MPYQTFPWQSGDSNSFNKLAALYLPDISGKTVLDVGCNLGFFCGYAAFQGAASVVGIDKNPEFIAQAKNFFPQCSFYCQDWQSLDGQYDIILFLSALHYAEDQKEILDFLMSHLTPNGLLVLELGIAPGSEDQFVAVKRSIDTRFFPTQTKFAAMTQNYVYKCIGHSVQQAGDPIPRFVYHLRHKLPTAILLMDEHYSGKSTIAEAFFNEKILRISGDYLYYLLSKNSMQIDSEVKQIIISEKNNDHINCAKITDTLCDSNLFYKICDLLLEKAKGNDFLLDMYIPYKFRQKMCDYWYSKNFFVVDVALYSAHVQPYAQHVVDTSTYKKYIEHLQHNFLINETAYLAANPDVAKAVAQGQMPSGQYHYWNFGRHEKRKLRPDK